jgi:hypothetical protein
MHTHGISRVATLRSLFTTLLFSLLLTMQVPCCTTSALGWGQAGVFVPGLLRLRGGKEFGAISGERRGGSAYLSACHPPTIELGTYYNLMGTLIPIGMPEIRR